MTYVPQRLAITNITKALVCVVTTSPNHSLTTGQVVRMHVPQNYGMVELNQNIYSITVLSNSTFSLQYTQVPPAFDVNSLNFTAFTIPAQPQFTAEVLPIGSGPTPILSPAPYLTMRTCESLLDDSLTNVDTVEIPY